MSTVQHTFQAPVRGSDDFTCTCGHWRCYTMQANFARDQHAKHKERAA